MTNWAKIFTGVLFYAYDGIHKVIVIIIVLVFETITKRVQCLTGKCRLDINGYQSQERFICTLQSGGTQICQSDHTSANHAADMGRQVLQALIALHGAWWTDKLMVCEPLISSEKVMWMFNLWAGHTFKDLLEWKCQVMNFAEFLSKCFQSTRKSSPYDYKWILIV